MSRDWDMEDCAPDIRVLWDRTPVARKAYLCDACGDPIQIGERYASTGLREDGAFRHERTHLWAYQDPSGCPAQRAKDLAELADQYARDIADF